MGLTKKRKDFIDRTARKPHGKNAIKNYNEPKAHYKGFQIILEKLNLSSQDKYFEIGCGGGVLLKMVLEKVNFCAAIDHSCDMVQLSIKNNRQAVENGRAEVVCGDAVKLPWEDNTFTAGASANMFFFIEQPQVVLFEIFRVLKPGGRFVMVTMGKGLLGKITFGWLYSLRTYSNKEMKSMLMAAGFCNIDIKTRFSQICCCEKPL